MLFTTFYFSGTGNTKWVAEQLERIVVQSGHQSKLYSIDNFDRSAEADFIKELKESTYIGIANPIYGADVPPIMKRFIMWLTDCLKSAEIYSVPLYVINTFGYVNAFGPFEAGKLFDQDCFKMMAYVNIRLCNNISTYEHKSKLVSVETQKIKKKRAIGELQTVIERLLSSQNHIKGIGLYLLPGYLIRSKSGNSIQNHFQSLSVQENTCNRCMSCVHNCPTHAILFQNQQFQFTAACTACMRCYNFCPTASILVNGKFTDPKEYFRYRGPES